MDIIVDVLFLSRAPHHRVYFRRSVLCSVAAAAGCNARTPLLEWKTLLHYSPNSLPALDHGVHSGLWRPGVSGHCRRHFLKTLGVQEGPARPAAIYFRTPL